MWVIVINFKCVVKSILEIKKKKINIKDIKILRVYIFNNMKKVVLMCVIMVFLFVRCFDKRESYWYI